MTKFNIGDIITRKDKSWSSKLCARCPNNEIPFDKPVRVIDVADDNYGFQNLEVLDEETGIHYGYHSENCILYSKSYIEEDE